MQATVQSGSWQKQWGMLVARAWSDEALKDRLMEDPRSVLEEFGIDVPADVELRVVEDTDEVRHLVLPASPTDDLDDEELTADSQAPKPQTASLNGSGRRSHSGGRSSAGLAPDAR